MRRYRESEAHVHAGRVALDRCVEKPLNLGESDNLVEFLGDLSPWNWARLMLMADISASDTTIPLGYWPVSSSQRTVRPVLVVVAEISSTMTR
jgi:hypothetical protein